MNLPGIRNGGKKTDLWQAEQQQIGLLCMYTYTTLYHQYTGMKLALWSWMLKLDEDPKVQWLIMNYYAIYQIQLFTFGVLWAEMNAPFIRKHGTLDLSSCFFKDELGEILDRTGFVKHSSFSGIQTAPLAGAGWGNSASVRMMTRRTSITICGFLTFQVSSVVQDISKDVLKGRAVLFLSGFFQAFSTTFYIFLPRLCCSCCCCKLYKRHLFKKVGMGDSYVPSCALAPRLQQLAVSAKVLDKRLETRLGGAYRHGCRRDIETNSDMWDKWTLGAKLFVLQLSHVLRRLGSFRSIGHQRSRGRSWSPQMSGKALAAKRNSLKHGDTLEMREDAWFVHKKLLFAVVSRQDKIFQSIKFVDAGATLIRSEWLPVTTESHPSTFVTKKL